MAMKSKDKVIKRYPNGATLIYYRHEVDQTTKATIGFKTGSRTDGTMFGITHFLEHMLFHNCMGKKQIDFAKMSSRFDSMQNAYTSYNFVATSFDCPNENFGAVVKQNRELLRNRRFTQEQFEKEREVVKEEAAKRADAEDDLRQAIYMILEKYPYKQISVVGYEPSLDAMTVEDLVEHANSTFVSENLIMSVCSSLPFEAVEAIMDEYIVNAFPSDPDAEVMENVSVFNCHQNLCLQDNENGSSSADIEIMFRCKDNPVAGRKYRLLESFIFNGMDGRLHDALRIKQQLCYSSYFENFEFDTLLYKRFNITTTPKKINSVIEAIGAIVQDVRENGITQEEFKAYKRFLKNQHARVRKLVQPVEPVEMLNNYIIYGEPFRLLTLKDLESITYEEANRHIKQLFADTNVLVAISGDYGVRSVMPTKRIFATLGARMKEKAPEFDIASLLDKNSYDLMAYASTEPLTDKQRSIAMLIADHNRQKEHKARQVVYSHPKSTQFSDDDFADIGVVDGQAEI